MCKQTYLTGKVLCDLLVGADSSEASAFMIFQYVGVVQWWATLLLGLLSTCCLYGHWGFKIRLSLT